MLLLGFSVVPSETEQVLGMSSFAFGMLLIAAGVVAYFLNHALKPEGWTPAPQGKACRLKKPSHGFARDQHGITKNPLASVNPWPLIFVVNSRR